MRMLSSVEMSQVGGGSNPLEKLLATADLAALGTGISGMLIKDALTVKSQFSSVLSGKTSLLGVPGLLFDDVKTAVGQGISVLKSAPRALSDLSKILG